jgi:hypothetical protein
MKVWILTSEHNEYDQHGEYFIEAFYPKPSGEKIVKALEKVNDERLDDYIDHILDGGGRVGFEHIWYHLKEIETN